MFLEVTMRRQRRAGKIDVQTGKGEEEETKVDDLYILSASRLRRP